MELTFLEQKETILQLLNKIVSICKDTETAAKELLILGFSQVENNYTAWLNPFGSFKFKAFIFFDNNEFDATHICKLIERFAENYPKDTKEKSDKIKTVLKIAPKLSSRNAKEKALSFGCKENVEMEVNKLIESVDTCENTAIKAAYIEKLDYMKEVLHIANTLDYEIELNHTLQEIGTIWIFDYVRYDLRQILDIHRYYNYELSDKDTATKLVYSHYFEKTKSKETAIQDRQKQIDSICESTKKYLKKNGTLKSLSYREQSDRNMLIERIDKLENEIKFIKEFEVI